MAISTPVGQSYFLQGNVSSLWLLPLLVFQQRYSVLASLICLHALEYLGYILCIGIVSSFLPDTQKGALSAMTLPLCAIYM